MKKLSALLLALLMMMVSVAGMAEDAASNAVPATELDLAGLLTEETKSAAEAMYDDALAAGRKITTTVKLSDWPAGITGDETIDAAINDVLDALVISTYEQGDETYFALNLSGTDVLTFGAAQSGADTYVSSNLLGGTIVINEAEIQPVLERLIDMFVLMGAFTEDDAAEIKAQLGEMIELVKAELAAAMEMPEFNVDLTALDLAPLMEALTPIVSKVTVAEVTMQPKNCDPATTVATLTLTPEEFKSIITGMIKFLQANPDLTKAITDLISFDAMMAEAGEEMTFDQLLAEALTELENTELAAGDGVYSYYMNDAGELVAMTVVQPMADGEETVNVELNYYRLTTGEGVTHNVVLLVDGVTMTVNVLVNDARVYVGFDMRDEEIVMNVAVDVNFTETETASNTTYAVTIGMTDPEMSMSFGITGASDYTKNGVDFVGKETLDVLVNDMKVLHVDADVASGEPGESIMTGDVVRPAELNDGDFANWFVGIVNGLQSWLGTAMQSLPESVLTLMLGGM